MWRDVRGGKISTVPAEQEICRHLDTAEPRLGPVRMLAIDGPSGAGKTTFAAAVLRELRRSGKSAAHISTDDFATWDQPVSWWPRLADGVLWPLSQGEQGGYRAVDWSSGQPRPGEFVTVGVPEVLVLEGVSAGRASVRPVLSHLCWMQRPDERARLDAAVGRDGEAERAHLREWQAFERDWFAADDTAEYADSHIVNTCSVPMRLRFDS